MANVLCEICGIEIVDQSVKEHCETHDHLVNFFKLLAEVDQEDANKKASTQQ